MKLTVQRFGLLLTSIAVAGCGQTSSKTATQVAAKVNQAEISVHQINAALAQLPNIKPEATQAASETVLERLIDQELLVQKAQAAKSDRDPRVVQALEAARRNVLATAWVQKIVADVAKPDDTEIKQYVRQHPEYFSDRRVYVYRSIAVQATADQAQSVEQKLASEKKVDPVLEFMRANGIAFVANVLTKSSEQLPSEVMPRFVTLKNGEVTTFPFAGGVEPIELVDSHAEPVDPVQGRPFVEKHLIDQRRNERIASEINSLEPKQIEST